MYSNIRVFFFTTLFAFNLQAEDAKCFVDEIDWAKLSPAQTETEKRKIWNRLEDELSLRPVTLQSYHVAMYLLAGSSQGKEGDHGAMADQGASHVYRSTRVTSECQLKALQKIGFSDVVRPTAVPTNDFKKNVAIRIDAQLAEDESRWAKGLGLNFHSTEMRVHAGQVASLSPSQFDEYHALLRGKLLEPLRQSKGLALVHCFHGRDRTGLLSAMLLLSESGAPTPKEVYDNYMRKYPVKPGFALAYAESEYEGIRETFNRLYLE